MEILQKIAGLSLVCASLAMPVAGEVVFSSGKYDFGFLREDNGPATGKVSMVNVGPGPTFIRNVRTTCGCTDATFTEGMIEEGDSAIISFTYDPERRVGAFDKSVKVFVGQDNKMHVIRITGTVIASRRTLETEYPDSVGDLRLSSRLIDAGQLRDGESRNYFVHLYNPTDRSLRPTADCGSGAVSVAIEPAVLEPGGTAVAGIYVNSRREPEPGEKVYVVRICSDADGMISDMGEIRVGAEIIK